MDRLLFVLRTVRYLRPRQVMDRLMRGRGPSPRLAGAPPTRGVGTDGPLRVPSRFPSLLEGSRFRFLNDQRVVVPEAFAAPKEPLLWDYNFHYFDGLLAESPSDAEKGDWIRTWLEEVPVGAKPAWDPYPASRRIANWIKWVLAGGVPPGGFTDSLAAQVRHLERTLEYHLMANHLLVNAVALVAAGCFFDGEEGDGWLARGSRLLEAELREQFLSDGAHYELSPVYHALITEDLLDLIQIARCTGCGLPAHVKETTAKAVQWLAWITRSDGRLPLLNDAAHGVAREPRTLLDYADRMGVSAVDGVREPLELSACGYFRYTQDRLDVVGDVAPVSPDYQPGHTHCDMLSFELCWEGRPLIVDTGTSTYEIGERRDTERGTAAHNTVQIGDHEQSEIWAGFRVARRARVERVESDGDENTIRAVIRAFPGHWTRLSRSWRFDGERMELDDRVIDSSGGPPPTARLHFHPDVTLTGEGPEWKADGVRIGFEGAESVQEVEYLHAPEFNVRLPARCLEVRFTGALRTVVGP